MHTWGSNNIFLWFVDGPGIGVVKSWKGSGKASFIDDTDSIAYFGTHFTLPLALFLVSFNLHCLNCHMINLINWALERWLLF
jgi:hypothetical protein